MLDFHRDKLFTHLSKTEENLMSILTNIIVVIAIAAVIGITIASMKK